MIEMLKAALKELPNLLENRNNWDSLIVNRRKPYTYRVFMSLPDCVSPLFNARICLHKFDVCHDHEAFSHPHPWPGAFIILSGGYQMKVGYSSTRESQPQDVLTTILSKHSIYEITNPLTWHSVIPLTETYTVMINGPTWDKEYAHTEVRTTKGKDLDKMPEEELLEHLNIFKKLVGEYNVVFPIN